MTTQLETPQTTIIDPTSGMSWTVRLVRIGERYGLGDCLVNRGRTLIEFYDRAYTEKFGPRGQFVSRYYIDTFMRGRDGIDLDGGIPQWTLSANAANQARDWADTIPVV